MNWILANLSFLYLNWFLQNLQNLSEVFSFITYYLIIDR